MGNAAKYRFADLRTRGWITGDSGTTSSTVVTRSNDIFYEVDMKPETSCNATRLGLGSVRHVKRTLIALATTAALLSAPTGMASAAPSATITIPDVVNQNARVAQAKLTNLGLTNVDFASATTKYQNVFNPSNWTVVGVEPTVGTAVAAGDPVVLKVTKP